MTSTGLPANSEPGNEQAREPTGEELKFISMNDAKELWADRIWEMDGMTWLFNDGQCECLAWISAADRELTRQINSPVIDHYYHFAAELLLGVWRAYTSLVRQPITAWGETLLPSPRRAWFIRHTEQSW
jgi:hypothetical protein